MVVQAESNAKMKAMNAEINTAQNKKAEIQEKLRDMGRTMGMYDLYVTSNTY